MSGLFALSIDLKTYQDNFLEDIFWGTFYHQHWSEDWAGISVWNQREIKVRTLPGPFRSAFKDNISDLRGTEGVGCCSPIKQPFPTDSNLGYFSLCFSGNIINRQELVKEFKDFGHTFKRKKEDPGIDVEVMAKLIAQGKDIVGGIKKMTKKIQGTYSLLALTSKGIYAACSPSAHWPLVVGKKQGAVVIATESGGFSNIGFELIRDVKPGETILIRQGRYKTEARMPTKRIQFCSFVWVYTAFPNGIFKGITASLVRKRLGASLAKKDIENGLIPDIVAPVPDSGRSHAIGYHQEFCRQGSRGKTKKIPFYDEILLKFPYAGRSYTPRVEEKRNLEAHIKLLRSGENFQGKKVVICDDSIVRGTQIKTNLAPKLRTLGVKEIHLRISNPELLAHCPWGKTTQKGELFAAKIPSKAKRIEDLGVESLEYNTIDDLVKAIGLPRKQLCVDCDLKKKEEH